jgi:hypothetical protein
MAKITPRASIVCLTCRLAVVGMFLLACCLRGATPPAGLEVEKLRGVVAAYLVKFADHIRWPDAVPPESQPFTIAVFGRDPFGDMLDRSFQGKTIGGHPIRAIRVSRVEDLTGSQIVFIDQPTVSRMNDVVRSLAGQPVLVIAFEPARHGVTAVELRLLKDGTVRYQLSVDAFKRAGLIPSAGLLRHALPADPGPSSQIPSRP